MKQSTAALCAYKWICFLVAITTLYLPERASAQFQLFYAAEISAINSFTNPGDDVITAQKKSAYWAFLPADAVKRKRTGIIFYSAPLVDERAYSTIMNRVARLEFPAFIVDLPLSLAFLAPFRADIIRRDFPEIESWVVAGHGIGGAIASCYAQSRNVEGLALFASYPFPLLNNLRWNTINVISLWGSRDGITRRQAWEDGRLALPGNTLFIEIEDANHSHFASLKFTMNGDNFSNISRSDQQDIMVNQIRLLMTKIDNRLSDSIEDDDCVPVSSSGSSDTDDSDDDYYNDGFGIDDDEEESISYDCDADKSGSKSSSRDNYFIYISSDTPGE